MSDDVERLAAQLYCCGHLGDVERIWAFEYNQAIRDIYCDMARLAIDYCRSMDT